MSQASQAPARAVPVPQKGSTTRRVVVLSRLYDPARGQAATPSARLLFLSPAPGMTSGPGLLEPSSAALATHPAQPAVKRLSNAATPSNAAVRQRFFPWKLPRDPSFDRRRWARGDTRCCVGEQSLMTCHRSVKVHIRHNATLVYCVFSYIYDDHRSRGGGVEARIRAKNSRLRNPKILCPARPQVVHRKSTGPAVVRAR